MHEQSSFDIIAESENGYVSLCACCHEFNVVYKNLLLIFNEDAMTRFFEWVISYRLSKENYQPLPHGRSRIYSSPHSNLFLVYSDEEIDELQELFAGVQLVLEARKITSSTHDSKR